MKRSHLVTIPIVALLLACLGTGAAAQDRGPILSEARVQRDYSLMFRIEHTRIGDRVMHQVVVRGLPAEHPLSELTNRHSAYLWRLLHHGMRDFRGTETERVLAHRDDDVRLQAEFHAWLRANPRFNAVLLPSIAHYLESLGGRLEGFSPAPKRIVTVAEALRITARNFYPDAIAPDGSVRLQVCTAMNGFRELPERDPYLEALGYAAIQGPGDVRTPEVQGAIRDLIAEIRALDVPVDSTQRVARAQGAAWAFAAHHPGIRAALLRTYGALAAYLPFTLADDEHSPPGQVIHTDSGGAVSGPGANTAS